MWYRPGDANQNAVGQVFVNASLTLLKEDDKKLRFNFAHDTDITPIIGALGVLSPKEHLPIDRVVFDSKWSTGDIVPMAGHLTIERLQCSSTPISDKGKYVRLVINEAVVPVDTCQSGPGYSCPLQEFTEVISKDLPSFVDACQVPEKYPQYQEFWWKYNLTSELNFAKSAATCAQTTTDPFGR